MCELFTPEAAREMDVVLMAVSGDFSKEHAPTLIADGGPIVIDNSSAWRMDEQTPLVVPEINKEVPGHPYYPAAPLPRGLAVLQNGDRLNGMHCMAGHRREPADREPELHHGDRRDGPVADPPEVHHQEADRLDVPGFLRGRGRGDGGAPPWDPRGTPTCCPWAAGAGVFPSRGA